MIYSNFVAVDFETANRPTADNPCNHICQIGIVEVINGYTISEVSLLVSPPDNYIDPQLSAIHGIDSNKTFNAPTFPEVWERIKHYFENRNIVAHNAHTFDEPVLHKNLLYHGIDNSRINDFRDTMKMFNVPHVNLRSLCAAFGIDCSNHHDALNDSRACAQLYLKYLAQEQPDLEKNIEVGERRKAQRAEARRDFYINKYYEKKKEETKEPIKPLVSRFRDIVMLTDEDVYAICREDMFDGINVVNTGSLSCMSRSEFEGFITEKGGRCTGTINKKTAFVVFGNKPGPAKVEQIIKLQQQGYTILCVNEKQFRIILKSFS